MWHGCLVRSEGHHIYHDVTGAGLMELLLLLMLIVLRPLHRHDWPVLRHRLCHSWHRHLVHGAAISKLVKVGDEVVAAVGLIEELLLQ